MLVLDTRVTAVAVCPPIVTLGVPVLPSPDPVIVTRVPPVSGPEEGEIAVTAGCR